MGSAARTPGTAVDDLFRAEYPTVVASVRLIVGSEAVAEEIAQEAFCRAIERWRRVRSYDNPAAWVQVVALRLAVRNDQRRRTGDRLQPAWSSATTDRPEDIDLQRAIAALPVGQRQAIVLHHLCDLSVDQVAEVLSLRPGTVKTQLHRGRAALAAALGEPQEVTDAAR